jgi:L-malate glycosyltransferase
VSSQGDGPSVLIVSAGELFGGAERQILALLAHLPATGVEVGLAVFQEGELARGARSLGLDVVVLAGSGAFRPTAVLRIADLVRRRHVTVAHFHGYKAATHVALARLLAPGASVASIHGEREFRDGSLLGRWRTLIYHRCEAAAIAASRAEVVYVSHELRKRRAARDKTARQHVILNGVDSRTVTDLARPPELARQRCNVVVVGRLDAVKGVSLAVQAMQSPAVPAAAHLWIVGEGPERGRLERLRTAEGLGERVTLTGFRRDAAAFIAHADLVLMPSLHEGLPYTMLEAIAAGTPIAASEVGGLAETLEHEQTAILFPPGDVAAIAAAIASAHSRPADLRAMAARARHRLLEQFDAATMARAYKDIYRLAAARFSRSARG